MRKFYVVNIKMMQVFNTVGCIKACTCEEKKHVLIGRKRDMFWHQTLEVRIRRLLST